MSAKEHQVQKCSDPKCGCEAKVTKTAMAGKGMESPLQCGCGKAMVKR
jgi:hypothetical protein